MYIDIYTCKKTIHSLINLLTTPHQPKQIKSKWYYIFWGIATLSVVIGQMHVANSYNRISDNLEHMILSTK